MRRAFGSTLLAVGLVCATGGCHALTAPAPGHSVSSPAATPHEGFPANTDMDYQPNPNAPLLLGDAALNIIVMQPTYEAPIADPNAVDKASQHEFTTELETSAPALMSAIKTAYETATYDRYKPSRVIVTNVAGTVAVGCITDTDDAEDQTIQEASEGYDIPGDLNVIAINQGPCQDETGAGFIGGFDAIDTSEYPVVDNFVFEDGEFEATAIHEDGHYGGVIHAGVATCQNPVRIKDCGLDPVGDPLSDMGYTQASSANHYTYPELGMLGLLHKDEIEDVTKAGKYKLVSMGENGLKVLVLPGPDHNPVYLSFEDDPTASSDLSCIPDPDGGSSNDPLFNRPNMISIGTSYGRPFACFAVHQRSLANSLQVRTMEYATAFDSVYGAQCFIADVIPPPRIPDKFGQTMESGWIQTGQTVYAGEGYTAKLVSISNNGATVSITKAA